MGNMIKLQASKPIEAYLSSPEGEAKGAVIVIHEVWGLDEHIKSVADRVCEQGYIALAPELLGDTLDLDTIRGMKLDLFDPEKRNEAQPKLRQHMTPMQNPGFGAQTLSSIKVCFNYLFDLPGCKSKVAIMGFCFGGTYSFNLAVHEPRLKAAVVYYGHSEYDVHELKQITCPVRAFYGENDKHLVEGLDDLKQKMGEAGVDFEAKVYPNTGHAFFNDSNPFAFNKTAAEDAWKITLKFLSKALV